MRPFPKEPLGPPPADFGPHDLAANLLQQMEVGRSPENVMAAQEALRIKGSQAGWTTAKAFLHILQMWQEYRKSTAFRSKMARGCAKWLNEGDYDNKQRWQDANGAGGEELGRRSQFADPDCKICSGSTWDMRSGKAVRCECWLAKRNGK